MEQIKVSSPQDIHTSHSSVQAKSELQFATSPRRLISWVPIILVSLGIIFLVLALANKQANNTQNISPNSVKPALTPSPTVLRIKIDIEGSVNQPGVYELTNDSRIQDVLISAGGLSAKADRMYVSKYINLSQRLSDGMKIYIPFDGEVLGANTNTFGVANYAISPNNNSGSLININDASQERLESLSGIGPVTAKKIIDSRPYQNVSELLTRHILSQSVYNKNKAYLSIN